MSDNRSTAARKAKPAAPHDKLDFYARPAEMTLPGEYLPLFQRLPDDVASLARIVQGLAIHEYVASEFYDVALPEARRSESHIRRLEPMLDRLFAIDTRPLTVPRPPDRRLVGSCHHFMLLLLAMLQVKGVPARGRCGFGSYFNAGFFEDHWLCEYWDAGQGRWVLADPQFDEVWQARLHIDHDVLDVPRDRFLVAADAWAQCRSGQADPSKFGIFKGNLRGLWFVAGDLVHDLAALNRMELLPWDTWGAMPGPNQLLQGDRLGLFDRLAGLTHAPDESLPDLRIQYESDDRLRVPRTVFNSVLNRPEVV